MSARTVTGYTVYDHPLDFPGHFVVRRWEVISGDLTFYPKEATVHLSLEEARQAVPSGLKKFPRTVIDDPFIVETWM